MQLGHAYFDTGQAKQAIAAYTTALGLKPDDVNVMTDLGVMYHEDKQHRKALELFDQVLKLDPAHEQARFNKGVVLLTGLNDRPGPWPSGRNSSAGIPWPRRPRAAWSAT